MNKQRVLSGMQPTGPLHIGHYLGVLKNYVKLQEDYSAYFMVANLHSLTVFYPEYKKAHAFIAPLISDWLAAGLDPEKAVLFVQSDVPAHSELYTILSMYTPVSWLMRNPTYKEKQENIDKDIDSHGFLGYPVLQAADILLYRPEFVPIGEDQLPHLELTREIARRFNYYNADGGPLLPEPKPLLSEFPKVTGTDGRKMSKSYGNVINLADSTEELSQKLKGMKTDTNRVRRNDPGIPENCPVYSFYDFFLPAEKEEVAASCRTAAIGCKDCKQKILEQLLQALEPFRAQRHKCQSNPERINEILSAGADKAKGVAQETMDNLSNAMGMVKNYTL